jgi:hypothetical protein
MSSTNKTANYNLSLWEPGDTITHGDVNADNQAIDAAVKSAADGTAALAANLLADGYSRIRTGTYTGTGVSGSGNKSTLTFPFKPKFVIMFQADQGYHALGYTAFPMWGYSTTCWYHPDSTTIYYLYIDYSGNTMSWYGDSPTRQLNYSGNVYGYIAVG